MSLPSINGTNTANLLRFSGMASGIDTDSIIKQLMQVERLPMDRLNQKQTKLEWKRDAYRNITNTLRAFKDEYFDVAKPATNLTSLSSYKMATASSSNTAVATATANSTAMPGSHLLNVTQLATAANTSTAGTITKDLTGTGVAGLTFSTGVDNQFNVTLDGVTKIINLKNGTYATTADLISNGTKDGIKDLVDAAFGSGKITVAETALGSGILKFTAANSRVTLSSGTNNALAKLQITTGSSNRLNTSSTLGNLGLLNPLDFTGGNLAFTINNVNFNFNSNVTLSDMLNQINTSAAGVTMNYSEVSDQFTITAKQKGSSAITITNTTGNLFAPVAANSAIKIASGSVTNGKDAIFDLDSVLNITRSDNNFTIDGIAYSAIALGNTTITVNQDTEGIFKNIKAFVTKYNEVVSAINSKLSEKVAKGYNPLTDEQKASMKTEDIKLWEDKAKSGLLRNDGILQKAVNDMRRAMYDSISGVSGDLTQIGISTGGYQDNGKLVIDEDKLRAAIVATPEKVQSLFAKSSTIAYSPSLTSAQRTQRYNEAGIAFRLSDILQDNIRTSRDSYGVKGSLIEKAGIVADLSEFFNTIDDEIKKNNIVLSDMQSKLSRKETFYYTKFTAMEKAISQMNTQSSWLSQQLAGGK